MNLQVLKTGNDEERKFVVGLKISEREKTYSDSTEALSSPMASKIFGFPWTQTVTIGGDFVTIQKQDWVDWAVLEEPLKGLIEEHFSNYSEKNEGDAIEENPMLKPIENPGLDSAEAQTIQKLIEEQINPALASHNGFVVLHGLRDNKLYLEMGGGCQGCAMSYMTLKEGIENAVRGAVPSITEVIDVTNHAAGENPFYS